MINDGTKEYFEKLKIAEQFCKGNIEKAKKMLSGDFKDIIILKGRFSDEDEEYYGFFMTFFSTVFYTIRYNFFVIANYTVALHNPPFDNWQTFYSKMIKTTLAEDYDKLRDEEYNKRFIESLNREELISIIQWVETNDITGMTNLFCKITADVLNVRKAEVDIDFEKTTSLILYENHELNPDKRIKI